MRPSRLLVLTAVSAASISLALPASAAPPSASPGGFSARTAAQIDALAHAKLMRSPTQRKVDSKLLAADRIRRGVPVAAGVSTVDTGVTTDAAGRTSVDVTATVTNSLLDRIVALGGRVRDAQPKARSVRADVPLASIEALAATPSVTRVAVARGAMTANAGESPRTPTKAERERRLRQRVATTLGRARAGDSAASRSRAAVAPTVGAVTSEGDVTHAADTARTRFRVSGIGVKVGVLSDGVDSLAASIASGDLPVDTEVLPGEAGSGDEGTAMLEIVHDLAPKAKLAFATAFTSAESFAANIRALRAAGADVIVDDVIYFAESPFQDGPIAQAVIDVTNDGAPYFSSAGNEQNVDDGTAGNYEGDYRPSGRSVGKFAGDAHDFDPGAGVQVLDPVSADTAGVPAILHWADPLGGSGNDYDLYGVDAAGTVTAFSNDVQDGDDDPLEGFYVPGGTLGLAIVKFSGEARYFQITPFRGLFVDRDGLTGYVTPGVTRGHSAVPAAYSVAAVPASVAFGGVIAPGVPNPSGPFPSVYDRRQKSEVFTSDGPRRVFFNPDGTPITPGNFTSTGGTVRLKPDISAADGVVTTVPGFERFFGTSASAPHAAAIAALVLGSNPGITPGEVRTAITATALDIEQAGYDRDTGYGIVMANRLLRRTGATPQPYATAGVPVITPTTGDGDEFLEPGESVNVAVPVTNEGDATATQVRVQLTTPTPGVAITPAVRSYGRIAAGATTTVAPFTLAVSSSYEPGVPLELRIKVSFVGAYSPQTRVVSLPVGQPSDTVVDVAYAGPPVPIPDASTVGATVPLAVADVGRISRLTFAVDGTACSTDVGSTTVGIDHTFDGDLVATLTAPGGQQVVLFDGTGGSGHNFCQTVLTDGAADTIQGKPSTFAPFTGSFRPAQLLSGLVGQSADGTWTLRVEDTALVDVGSVRAFSLHVSGYEQPTP